MAASKIMQIVRSVTGPEGYIYNDKMKSGARSIKVGMGFNDKLTDAVKAALEAQGYTVQKVQGYKMWGYDTHRLHVKVC